MDLIDAWVKEEVKWSEKSRRHRQGVSGIIVCTGQEGEKT